RAAISQGADASQGGRAAAPQDARRDSAGVREGFLRSDQGEEDRRSPCAARAHAGARRGLRTDVCVLQSCLGLLDLGHEVFVAEALLFSSSRNVEAATARMGAEGAVAIPYKTLFYELIEAVEGGRHADLLTRTYGPFPDDLPDSVSR